MAVGLYVCYFLVILCFLVFSQFFYFVYFVELMFKRQLKTFLFDNSFFVTIGLYFNYVPFHRSYFA